MRLNKDIGLYLVAESIDGGGKGTAVNGIVEHYKEQGKRILDLREQWQDNSEKNILKEIYGTTDIIPYYEDLKKQFIKNGEKLDLIVLCEPTWANVGLKIRRKIIHEIEGKNFGAADTAKAYALDRQELLPKVIIPATMDGIDVISERNFCSSLTYQSTMNDEELGVEEILKYPGNVLAIRNRPDLYIICDLRAETAIQRLAMREKQDQCKFEKLPFLKKLQEKYMSNDLRKRLNSHGSMVVYLNTDEPTTMQETKTYARKIIIQMKEGVIQNGEIFNMDKTIYF